MSSTPSSMQPLQEKSVASLHGPVMRQSSTSLTSSHAGGASLMGLLASKRLAHNVANRIKARRAFTSSSNVTSVPLTISYEPTYRMEPATKFKVRQVEATLTDLVNARMTGFKYTPKVAAMVTKILTSEIKDAVKLMKFERHKIVCVVTIGQNTGQDLRVTSLCSWDTQVDTSASYTWADANAFCCATVFGIYHE